MLKFAMKNEVKSLLEEIEKVTGLTKEEIKKVSKRKANNTVGQ